MFAYRKIRLFDKKSASSLFRPSPAASPGILFFSFFIYAVCIQTSPAFSTVCVARSNGQAFSGIRTGHLVETRCSVRTTNPISPTRSTDFLKTTVYRSSYNSRLPVHHTKQHGKTIKTKNNSGYRLKRHPEYDQQKLN